MQWIPAHRIPFTKGNGRTRNSRPSKIQMFALVSTELIFMCPQVKSISSCQFGKPYVIADAKPHLII